jgi:hypothetical protein
MWAIVLYIMGIMILDFHKLWQEKQKTRLMMVYYTVTSISLLLAVMIALGHTPPGPHALIESMIRWLRVGGS